VTGHGHDGEGSDAAVIDRAAAMLEGLARRDVALAPLTTYKVGGPAALAVEANDEADLLIVAKAVRATGVRVLVVGKGSNLLVADVGFPGLAVTLAGGFETVVVDGTDVTAGAAVALPVLARQLAAAGLTGFEWAVGVPGSVGGAVRMNAGGHGSDMAAVLISARTVDLSTGESRTRSVSDLAFGYRHSAVAAHEVICSATLGLAGGDVEGSKAQLSEIVRWRREHQPGGQNCGSVFTNPPGDSAGRLIDSAGGKGLRIGTAQVSEKHANFIQADPGGRAADVVAVIRAVRRLVEDHVGVSLHPELQLAGFDDADLTWSATSS
jgi:UDP-N-acetylmuramate dehydrogenase